MRPLFVYAARDPLSPAELTAACLDGHLVGIGDAFVPADAVETMWLRAASLGPVLQEGVAAIGLSAAWVWGVADDEPSRHSVQRAVPRRLHQVFSRRTIYHDVALDADDVVRIAGIAVTSRARTLVDLARHTDTSGTARRWIAAHPEDAAAARVWLDRHPGFPHKRRAVTVLDGQEEVTR